jgi:hypothetical protein
VRSAIARRGGEAPTSERREQHLPAAWTSTST